MMRPLIKVEIAQIAEISMSPSINCGKCNNRTTKGKAANGFSVTLARC
ncbi:MAG: hypothetical protein WA790_15310 [Sulfitobacter sp.]